MIYFAFADKTSVEYLTMKSYLLCFGGSHPTDQIDTSLRRFIENLHQRSGQTVSGDYCPENSVKFLRPFFTVSIVQVTHP